MSGDPWSFLMCSCFIDFLVKMILDREVTKAVDYKNFIRTYMVSVNPLYATFTYDNGQVDLPEQCTMSSGVEWYMDFH